MPSINDKGEIIQDSQSNDEINSIISQGNENVQNVVNQGNEDFEKKYGYDLPAPDVNSDDPMVRQEALKHFQDQNKPFAPGENVPPQVTPTPIEQKPANELADIKPGQERFLQKKLSEVEERVAEDPLKELQKKLAEEQSKQQEEFAKNVQNELNSADIKSKHEATLEKNSQANQSIKPLTPLSEKGQNFFANQDKVAEDARIEAINKIQAQVDELNKRLEELRQGVVTPQQPPLPEEQEASAEVDVADDLESQLKELRREDTPEQRIVALDKQMKEILGEKELSELSDAEKLQFIDLSIERQKLAKEISAEVQESERKRIRKEKIVKIVAGVAGAGIALATPPVSIAAVVAITLGGRFATPLIRKAANSLRNRSEHLKYSDRSTATLEQLNDMDKRQRRNEWWANRLGEVAAVVSGGTAGYGLGKFAQALFGWQGITGAGNGPEVTQGDISGGQAKGPLGPEEASIGPDTPPVEPVTPPSGPETLPSDGVLVQNGRVDLPGSAWNGNLAGEAAGNLPGEALNYSNYTGGWHEMAPRMLENDLISNGLTRTQLLDNLGTPGTHQLLNEYLQAIQSGTADPNLVDALNNIGTEGAKNLLNIINK